VEQGRNIAGPLAETKVFPPMVVQMVGGEATGALDAMLSKVAISTRMRWTTPWRHDRHDGAPDHRRAGTVIGFIVIAMYLPIFTLPMSWARTEGGG